VAFDGLGEAVDGVLERLVLGRAERLSPAAAQLGEARLVARRQMSVAPVQSRPKLAG
jgi:hypothetical protein